MLCIKSELAPSWTLCAHFPLTYSRRTVIDRLYLACPSPIHDPQRDGTEQRQSGQSDLNVKLVVGHGGPIDPTQHRRQQHHAPAAKLCRRQRLTPIDGLALHAIHFCNVWFRL